MRLHETMYGKRFFEGQIPEFIRSLNAIQLSLIKIHQGNEKLASLKKAELEINKKN